MEEQAGGGLGQWLKDRCREENWSLRQAAIMTSLSHATIASIIKGNGQVSAGTVKKLADAFGGNGEHRLVLEDTLLILAGYRSKRENELSETLARLLDVMKGFNEPKLKLMEGFVNYLAGMEK